jgi:glycosyltransferase involved in cell wall biosynthesis
LVPPGDATALAGAINELLVDAKDLPARAQARAQEFSWERLAGPVEEIYASVI